MTPLQRVAMGVVVIALDTLEGFDLLPDWAGWALVVWGVSALDVPERARLVVAAVAAGAVSLALWFPAVHRLLADQPLSLRWAASLPELLLAFLLGRALVAAAGRTDPPDRRFRGRFGVAVWLAVAVVALPPVAAAVGSRDALAAADVGFILLWLWLAWNLFAAHARPWAADRAATRDAGG